MEASRLFRNAWPGNNLQENVRASAPRLTHFKIFATAEVIVTGVDVEQYGLGRHIWNVEPRFMNALYRVSDMSVADSHKVK